MRTAFFAAYLLLAVSSCQALSGTSNEPSLQPRGSSGSGSGSDSKSPSVSHKKGKAPAHEGPSVRLFGVDVTPGHRSVSPSHSSQSTSSVPPHPGHSSNSHPASPINHPAPHSHGTRKHTGNLGHLVAGLHPTGPHKPFGPARKPGRPEGSKNIPKSEKASQTLRKKPAKTTKGQKWWNTPGGTPRASPCTHGTSDRYERQKKYRLRKKLGLVGQPPDEHPDKHQHNPPGGPGSPGAGSHAVSKRRLGQ